jgi:hypothetical protein
MNITRIAVSSQIKVQHPSQEFSTLSNLVTLEASIVDGESPSACLQKLQAQADNFNDAHMERRVKMIADRDFNAKVSRKASDGTSAKAAKLANDRITYWRRMAKAFEDVSERRLLIQADLEGALFRAHKRIAELESAAGVPAVIHAVHAARQESDDPIGDHLSARLLIQNLRRELRERPPARKVA